MFATMPVLLSLTQFRHYVAGRTRRPRPHMLFIPRELAAGPPDACGPTPYRSVNPSALTRARARGVRNCRSQDGRLVHRLEHERRTGTAGLRDNITVQRQAAQRRVTAALHSGGWPVDPNHPSNVRAQRARPALTKTSAMRSRESVLPPLWCAHPYKPRWVFTDCNCLLSEIYC